MDLWMERTCQCMNIEISRSRDLWTHKCRDTGIWGSVDADISRSEDPWIHGCSDTRICVCSQIQLLAGLLPPTTDIHVNDEFLDSLPLVRNPPLDPEWDVCKVIIQVLFTHQLCWQYQFWQCSTVAGLKHKDGQYFDYTLCSLFHPLAREACLPTDFRHQHNELGWNCATLKCISSKHGPPLSRVILGSIGAGGRGTLFPIPDLLMMLMCDSGLNIAT